MTDMMAMTIKYIMLTFFDDVSTKLLDLLDDYIFDLSKNTFYHKAKYPRW